MTFFAPLVPWPFHGLAPHWFNLVLVDPPWRYESWSQAGEAKGANRQYQTYPPEEIAVRFPVGDLCDTHCLVLMWGTWPLFDRQLAVLDTWDLEFRSVVVWRKVFPSGKIAVGTGYRVRSMCEPLLIATRGSPQHRPFPGLFDGIRREHSRKPEILYGLIDALCPELSRRAELFARQRRPGFHGWGDELEKFAP